MWKFASLKKSKKKHSENTLSWFSLEPSEKIKNSHDAIKWLNCGVHYLNMKVKGKWVYIIDLKLCSSLKLDVV